ncbi:TolC family protein, partial [Dasania marina]
MNIYTFSPLFSLTIKYIFIIVFVITKIESPLADTKGESNNSLNISSEVKGINNSLLLSLPVDSSAISLNTISNTLSIKNTQTLSLEAAVQTAQANDPWLLGSQHRQESVLSLSDFSSTLPDPKITLGFANLPANNFDFGQENMTQFNVGVSQMFPRGDSLNIKSRQLKIMSGLYPYQRENRKAQVAVTVAKLWFDAYKAQESIALIKRDRSLFEQLGDVAEASYSSALGKTRQQDIIRAQLELTRLDDKLTVLNQQRDVALQRLTEWRSGYFLPQESANNTTDSLGLNTALYSLGLHLDKHLPEILLLNPELYVNPQETQPQTLYQYMINHAVVQELEQKIKASSTGIELAKQKYKPEWGINASYGYRDEDPTGRERSDLFSIGVSFDVPLFTSNRQDKEVQSAVSKTEALRTDKWLLLRKLMASFEATKSQLLRLNQRLELYRMQLLPQTHEQAEASLTAYTNDDGDFAEVVRARIAVLNTNLDALSIEVDRQKSHVQLNY